MYAIKNIIYTKHWWEKTLEDSYLKKIIILGDKTLAIVPEYEVS